MSSGMVPRESARRRFSVSFYVTAMLFIIFDVESIFLFPWATIVRELKVFGIVEMGIFIATLLVGIAVRLAQGGAAMGLNNELIVPRTGGRSILLADADAGTIALPRTGAAERTALQSGFVTTTLGKVIQWGRYSSLWPALFGLACCAIEMMATGAARYDMSRFGCEVFRASPRQSDLMIVAGRVSQKMAPGPSPHLRPDAGAQVGDQHGRLRLQRRHVQQLRDRAGRRQGGSGRRLHPRLSTPPGGAAGRGHEAAEEDRRGAPRLAARVAPMTAVGSPMSGARAADLLERELPTAVRRRDAGFGEVTVWIDRADLVGVCTLLRDHPDAAYTTPVFVTAVDWPDREPAEPRFDVVYMLRSLQYNDVCRLIVQVTEDDPNVPTLEGVFAGMDWHERECFDLLGITFTGHHDLKRILLPTDWDGHPLRKDYASFGEPIAFTHNLEWALPAQERPRDMPGGSR